MTTISRYIFVGCSALTSVTLPWNGTEENFYDLALYTHCGGTAYVPYFSKAAYLNIYNDELYQKVVGYVESTDISELDNAIYVDPFTANVGGVKNIEVKLKNDVDVTSYGFELVLPEGMSIATTSNGSFNSAVTLSGRNSGFQVVTNKLSDNVYKVAVASLSGASLTDNDGTVLTIRARVADDADADDTYAVKIQNPLIVEPSEAKPAVEETVAEIDMDMIKGDVNGDAVVDLADAVLVINHYVGKTLTSFVEKTANVNSDDDIDLADAVRIINYYVGKISSLSRQTTSGERDPQ